MRIIKRLVLSIFVSQRLGPFLAKSNKQDLRFLKELIEAGTIQPVIDRTYSLSEAPEAIRYISKPDTRAEKSPSPCKAVTEAGTGVRPSTGASSTPLGEAVPIMGQVSVAGEM